jgi:hypothetical protein
MLKLLLLLLLLLDATQWQAFQYQCFVCLACIQVRGAYSATDDNE